MGITFKLNKPAKTIAKEATGGDKALYFMANTARRLMDPYVPMATGTLADTVNINVRSGVAYIKYIVPYASAVFYGTRRNYNKEKHPLATARWDRAMLQTRKADLIRDVDNYIKGGYAGGSQ